MIPLHAVLGIWNAHHRDCHVLRVRMRIRSPMVRSVLRDVDHAAPGDIP